MANAVRYHNSRKSRDDMPVPNNKRGPELENPKGKARAIATSAAKEAARKADPRVRKSSAKRAEDKVISSAVRNDIDTPEDMRTVVRAARRAVKTRRVSAFPSRQARP